MYVYHTCLLSMLYAMKFNLHSEYFLFVNLFYFVAVDIPTEVFLTLANAMRFHKNGQIHIDKSCSFSFHSCRWLYF